LELMKKRLDEHLADVGVFDSRASAKAAVMEGRVSVDGRSDVKPGYQVTGGEEITVSRPGHGYVSRGGVKLSHALEVFDLDVSGKVVLDVGSSTGGFTDCLLRNGASHVIALDVGKGQLHWRLREDSRVTPIEGYNARYLRPGDLPVAPELAVVDVSFISLTRVIGPVFGALPGDGEVVALVKPQFEAGREFVRKGGVIKDCEVHLQVLKRLADWFAEKGMALLGVTTSPIKGPRGNIEFFVRIGAAGRSIDTGELEREVSRAHG